MPSLKQTVFLLAALFVSGCASTPVELSKASEVPSDRIYYHSSQNPLEAQIIVIRDRGFQGGGVFARFFIDGKLVANLEPGEFVKFTVPAGEHIFGAHLTDPFHAENTHSIDQNLIPGRIYQYRMLVDRSGCWIQREIQN